MTAAQHLPAQSIFEMQELAPGVYAAVVVPDPPAYAFANSLVVIGTDGVLVVDTQQSLTAARSLIEEIRRMTDVPVRWVVNTHWHGDHVNGNQAYAEAYPGVQFIAHASVPHDLATVAAERRNAELETLPASIREREKWLADGVGPDGTPLDAERRRAVERSAQIRREYLADVRATRVVPPSQTLSRSLQLRTGPHVVRVAHPGRAHTRGDVVVIVETAGIVAVGDLLEFGMPYFDDAFPAGWSRAVAWIASLGASVLVPAHGAVQRDRSLVRDTRALLAQVERTAACRAHHPDGEYCGAAPAVRVLEGRWNRQYRVSSPAFRSGFDTAVERALLEKGSR